MCDPRPMTPLDSTPRRCEFCHAVRPAVVRRTEVCPDPPRPSAWALLGYGLLVAASIVLVAAAEMAGVRLKP